MNGLPLAYVSVLESDDMKQVAKGKAIKMKRKAGLQGNRPLDLRSFMIRYWHQTRSTC